MHMLGKIIFAISTLRTSYLEQWCFNYMCYA